MLYDRRMPGLVKEEPLTVAIRNNCPRIVTGKRDDPWIVIFDNARISVENRDSWATSGAAKGALHRVLMHVRMVEGHRTRPTREQRAEWIESNCKITRLSRWKASNENRR